jgi:hypothetical protein
MAKYNHFQVIATAATAERVPKVPGAWYFGLPFVMDADVTWSDYFTGIEPRGFLVGIYPDGHAKAGQVYPLDLAPILAWIAEESEATPDDEVIDAGKAEAANFLGLAIEGTDYENDENMTVALAAGVPLRYIQQDQTKAPYEVDADVLAALPKLGIVLRKGHIFWNTVQ